VNIPPEPAQAEIETKSIYLLMALTLALVNLPVLWGTMFDHEGLVFSGFADIYTYRDTVSYIAKMRAGHGGDWLYSNPYTTEHHQPALIFTFYLFLGHVARLFGLSLTLVFHLARVGAGVFLLFGVKRLLTGLPMSSASRILAFAFIFLASGFGWFLRLPFMDRLPVEYSQAEAYLFQSMMHSPHLALSSALIVWSIADIRRYASGEAGRAALVRLYVWFFVLAWVHPRLVIVAPLVTGAAALWSRIESGADLKRWMTALAGPLVLAAIPMAAIYLSIRADPIWREWSRTRTPTDSPLVYLEAYGLLWPLAMIGAYRARASRVPWAGFLIAWLGVATLLPYLPMIAQRRLAQGWNVPLALLAGYAVGETLLPRLRAIPSVGKAGASACISLLCALLFLSTLMVVATGATRIVQGLYPGYASRDRVEAMRWLRENTSGGESVLCSTMSGIFVPAWAGNRVVVGHWAETLRLGEKQRNVTEFFDLNTAPRRRSEIRDEYDARYLLHGQWERRLGAYDPARDTEHWRPVWQGASMAIYEYVATP